jgi:hypothetical protein
MIISIETVKYSQNALSISQIKQQKAPLKRRLKTIKNQALYYTVTQLIRAAYSRASRIIAYHAYKSEEVLRSGI